MIIKKNSVCGFLNVMRSTQHIYFITVAFLLGHDNSDRIIINIIINSTSEFESSSCFYSFFVNHLVFLLLVFPFFV